MLNSKFLFAFLLSILCYQPSFAQAFDVIWTNVSGATATGNSLTKTAASGWGNSGAASENILAVSTDGWIESTVNETNTISIFGLSTSDTNNNYFTVKYGFLKQSGNLYIYENGRNKGWVSRYSTGDKLKIERNGTTITYKINNAILYTSTVSSSSQLLVDVALNSINATINDVQASFCISQEEGTSCDDRDANTTGDKIQADGCTCAGNPISAGSPVFEDDDNSGDGAVRYSGGKVIIGPDGENGTTKLNKPGDYKLYVEGGIITELCKIAIGNSSSWADYVFSKDYDLKEIEEVEQFIKENNHLPNVPSAEVVATDGIDVAKMDATLLRQIEELWLHMIELKKENDLLKKEVETLKH